MGDLRQRARLVHVVDNTDSRVQLFGCLKETHRVLQRTDIEQVWHCWTNDHVRHADCGERDGIDLRRHIDEAQRDTQRRC